MIADRLKKAIETSWVTPAEISRKTGIPSSRISEITTGKTKNPGVDTLFRIAKAIGASLDAIVCEEGEEGRGYQVKTIHRAVRSDQEQLIQCYDQLPADLATARCRRC